MKDITQHLKTDYLGETGESIGRIRTELFLPGLEPPAAIAVKLSPNRYQYVRLEEATWPDLMASRAERDDHIEHAVASRKDWIMKMDYLAPAMKDTQTITVKEATAMLYKEAAE